MKIKRTLNLVNVHYSLHFTYFLTKSPLLNNTIAHIFIESPLRLVRHGKVDNERHQDEEVRYAQKHRVNIVNLLLIGLSYTWKRREYGEFRFTYLQKYNQLKQIIFPIHGNTAGQSFLNYKSLLLSNKGAKAPNHDYRIHSSSIYL